MAKVIKYGKWFRRVSEWLAATLEMWCRETGCGFESRALRLLRLAHRKHREYSTTELIDTVDCAND